MKDKETTKIEKRNITKEDILLKARIISEGVRIKVKKQPERGTRPLPPLVLDIKDKILDMCAAPGSKTGQIAGLMKNKGLIIANDPNYIRLKALDLNLQRLGVMNVVITNMKGYFIKEKFDSILVDAPCSGTGAIRKSPGTVEIYNPKMIRKLCSDQKGLINNAFG